MTRPLAKTAGALRDPQPGSLERDRLEQDVAQRTASLERLEARRAPAVHERLQLAARLRALADHDPSTVPLERAIALYRASLGETSPDDGNTLWREANAELGAALLELYHVSADVEHARRAVRPLRNAIPLHAHGSREHRTLSRGMGRALRVVGEADRDVNTLRQAVSAFRDGIADAALDADDPTERARAVRDLAAGLRLLGVLGAEPERLQEAHGLLEEAVASIGDREPFTRTLLLAELRRVRESAGSTVPRSSAMRDALRAYAAGEARSGWPGATLRSDV